MFNKLNKFHRFSVRTLRLNLQRLLSASFRTELAARTRKTFRSRLFSRTTNLKKDCQPLILPGMLDSELALSLEPLTHQLFCRLALERSESAESAVEVISSLIDQYNQDDAVETAPKYGFFICDTKEAFVLNIVGKLWAAERITEGFRAFGKGFSVTTKIDKKSDGLEDKLKELGLLDGDELNFSEAFSMKVPEVKWPNDQPSSGFSAQKMFEVLRASAEGSEPIASSFVSVLKDPVAVHWLTGTPDPRESVFKPFIFTNDARVSPLTALKDDDETPLRKLHENRKWKEVGELLKTLEKSCVDEVDGYVDNAPTDELNELLKDCVEAEVKFYR